MWSQTTTAKLILQHTILLPFYKPGIDKAKISDLDKKRILRAIEAEMTAKGISKSQSPELLVSIFTKEKNRIDVYNNNYGFGWGWNPYWNGGFGSTVSSSTEGSLYIDLIDMKTNALVWQGGWNRRFGNNEYGKKGTTN